MKRSIIISVLVVGLNVGCVYLSGVDLSHRNVPLGVLAFLCLMAGAIAVGIDRDIMRN